MTFAGPLARRAAFLIFNIVVAVGIVEAMLLALVASPALLRHAPGGVRGLVQQVYRHFDRAVIQFEPACARFDPTLGYTLRPGKCVFANREYRTEVRVNIAGLRDELDTLDGPDVIMLGDSHVMGWGVQQDEAMPQRLARLTGAKVLNAGVSSYGTPREMRMLSRLNTRRLSAILLQYSDNDTLENRAYERAGNVLHTMSAERYQAAVDYYQSQKAYYPGKFTYRLLAKVLHFERPEPEDLRMEPLTPAEEAHLFLNVLAHENHEVLERVPLIVFEINEKRDARRPFIEAVAAASREPQYPAFLHRLITVDTSRFLTADDFYVLDDHMNATGHEHVAGHLVDALAAAGWHPQAGER